MTKPQGPRSKILSGGLKREPDFFWEGGGAEACYPAKIRVLLSQKCRKVDLKLTNSVLKRNVFTA